MQLANVEDIYPLSSTQSGMLFHTASAPNSGVYVAQFSCLLSGSLNLDMFKSAWQKVVQRHSALRTAFLWDGLDEPLQVVRQKVALNWEVLDWRGRSEQETRVAMDVHLRADRRRGFDLADAPLMRMLLVRLDDLSHRFVWTCHHLLADGWSSAIVLREVFDLYRASETGRVHALPTPSRYRDFIAWLQGRDHELAESYWRANLAGFSSHTTLRTPSVRKRRRDDSLHRVIQRQLSAKASASLGRVARELRLTLNVLVQSAWAVLLNRYSGERDIVYGTTVSGRPAALTGVENAVGLFICTLPVRAKIDDEQILRDWLPQLQRHLLESRQHEHTPLNRIREWSDVPAGEPLFDTILVLENRPLERDPEQAASVLGVEEVRALDQSNYPLAMLVVPESELQLTLVFDPETYQEESAVQILSHLTNLLSAIPSHLDRPIGDLPLLSEDERYRMLVEWNDTAAAIPEDRCIIDLISDQAARAPQAIAVRCGSEQRITYGEIESRSDDWARQLIGFGATCSHPVALCLERSLDLITGVLAIMKAGAAYVPLDPGYPRHRLELMVRNSGARLLLTSRSQMDGFSASEVKFVCVENLASQPANRAEIRNLPRIRPENPAYVIYTSGSTGSPKGVLVSHRNLLASTLARHAYYREPPSVFLLLSSIAFDSSAAGIFWTLSTGASLVVSEHRIEQDMGRLAACVAEQGVTHTLCLPTLYRLLLTHSDAGLLKDLRAVVVAGEACPPDLVELHRQLRPNTGLYNEYGPTEATVWCSVFDTRDHVPDTPVPIGRPIENSQLYVLDKQQRPVPLGVPGEIHVAGAGLSEGYMDQPQATAERFVSCRLDDRKIRLYRTGDRGRYLTDGNIEFLGRQDRQIKIRGYRIEPAEVEAALLSHPRIREAVVVSVSERIAASSDTRQALSAKQVADPVRSESVSKSGGVARLTAFLTTDDSRPGGREPTSPQLRDYLAEFLPAHMVPSAFLFLDEFPLLPNGKVDLTALQALPDESVGSRQVTVAPRDPTERQLADIWRKALQAEAIGVHDSFFDLGGDSILSIQVVSMAHEAGLELAPNDVINFPTIAELASRCSRSTPATDGSNGGTAEARVPSIAGAEGDRGLDPAASVPSAPAKTRPPLFMVHGMKQTAIHLQEYAAPDQSFYLLKSHWHDADLHPGATLEQMAQENLVELKSIQPQGPYFLGGFSIGGPVAFEISQELVRDGETVALLLLIDPPRLPGIHGSTPQPREPDAAPDPAEKPSVSDPVHNKLLRHLSHISALSVNAKLKHLADLVQSQFHFYVHRPLAIGLSASCYRLNLTIPTAYRKTYFAWVHSRAWSRYEPEPYEGNILIFRGSKSPHAKDMRSWERVVRGELEVEVFDGEHLDLMANPESIRQWGPRLVATLESKQRSSVGTCRREESVGTL